MSSCLHVTYIRLSSILTISSTDVVLSCCFPFLVLSLIWSTSFVDLILSISTQLGAYTGFFLGGERVRLHRLPFWGFLKCVFQVIVSSKVQKRPKLTKSCQNRTRRLFCWQFRGVVPSWKTQGRIAFPALFAGPVYNTCTDSLFFKASFICYRLLITFH